MMASKVKEKLKLGQIDEIKCHELINKLKASLNLWFIYGKIDNGIIKKVLNACVEIILHGIKNEGEKLQTTTTNINALDSDSSPTSSTASTSLKHHNNNENSYININALYKIIDDFEWVRNAVCITRNPINSSTRNFLSSGPESLVKLSSSNRNLSMQSEGQGAHPAITQYVTQWLNYNLNEQNLCGFIQYLVNDRELLEEHYHEEALLRQEKYVTIIVMGLTAFQTQQYELLSKIDVLLAANLQVVTQNKRSTPQSNADLPAKRKFNLPCFKPNVVIRSTSSNNSDFVVSTIRKTKSLPEFINKTLIIQDKTHSLHLKRPRCKTVSTFKHRTSPQYIPQKKYAMASPQSSFLYDYDDNLPTTSQASSNRSKSPLSNYTLNSNKSTTSSLMSTSASSSNSNSTTKFIELINTDNIKIWTDHSWELKQKSKKQKHQQISSCAIPTPLISTAKPCKSFSPLNSFLTSLFSTPPSYTSWFVDYDTNAELETTEAAIESIIPDNNSQNSKSVTSTQQQSSSLSLPYSTVFDTFLPIDGKKLRSPKSQNFFDDVNTKLSYPTDLSNESPSSSLTSAAVSTSANTKNCQSLTRFLQMSHLSRNNTDLEKENAHFRISEAIISAIEHIKWNKLETDNSPCEATPLATDCLASTEQNRSTTSVDSEREHIPYAELEEVGYDQLSAEVVGLSLISKFDEKHLPKVSELKWLVSDDDTPQKLLPMPDLTSSANPDDHIIHSATRGTRYWAPPRQQIIFTDHPPPNRKELLKKQNNRCAGCGMHVSPEYIHSFRYCTYLGKYHCTGCHRNQISATPAKILQAWDFKCYPVSVFAYRLLEQMYSYPLFYVPDLNPALYIRCKSLNTARNKRLQLKYVKDFIRMCRFALREQRYFESVPDYITADVDNWSMSDFIDARSKCLHRSIDELINKCENHIFNCVLCTARGFLCEYCHVDIVIYPWGSRISRCDRCGTCFHAKCWKSMREKCCRCQRFDKRQYEISDVI